MQLQQGARILRGRFPCGRSSLGRPLSGCSGAPLESSTRCFSLPSAPQKPAAPFAADAPRFCSTSMCSDLWARFGSRRGFCGGAPAEDYDKVVDEINLKFAEAREEIDAALESKDTVYFNEEAECAREAVKVVLDMYKGLLGRMPEKERAALQRSMGLKMEQLKAELEQLNE